MSSTPFLKNHEFYASRRDSVIAKQKIPAARPTVAKDPGNARAKVTKMATETAADSLIRRRLQEQEDQYTLSPDQVPAEFHDHAKNPYHKVLTSHGFQHVGTKHSRNRFASNNPSGNYTEHRYTHPEHGRSVVVVSSLHMKPARDKQHSWRFHHEQSNGIMAPSMGDTKPQLDRALAREYGPAKG